MHGLRTVLLRENIFADRLRGLLTSEFTEQMNNFRINIDCTDFAALGGIKVDASLGRIAKVSGDGDRVGLEVNILPPEAAAFTTSDAGVNEETHHSAASFAKARSIAFWLQPSGGYQRVVR